MSRQLGLWGDEGQQSIRRARIAVGGLGGIGAASALMLAKAGIGTITVCDRDKYETENIVEQAFATRDTVGKPKAQVSKGEMSRHTCDTRIEAFTADLSKERHVARLVDRADALISGVDNPEARFILARACNRLGIPLILCANVGWSVFHTVYMPDGPGYLASWKNIPDLRWRQDVPDMTDPITRDKVMKEWNIWVIVLGGYTPEAVEQLLTTDQTYYSYAAPQAFLAASLGVLDTLKLIVGQGSVMKYPDVHYYDTQANRQLDWNDLLSRRNSIRRVWNRGPAAVAACARRWKDV